MQDGRLYSGSSHGFQLLQQAFFEYAKEVNTNRSIPDVRDGLKTVQRRALYQIQKHLKPGALAMSIGAIGWINPLHPHSNDAIYEAIAMMTDSKGLWDPAPLVGHGAFGVASSSASPSQPRYTKLGLSRWAKDWIEDLEFTDFKTAEVEDQGEEPAFLPARFPTILIPGHRGMGLGVGTDIPPYNFWDIIDLTETFIKHGDFRRKLIYPDFPTGGSMYADPVEAAKMMYTGKGTYKVRATYSYDRSDHALVVSDIPYASGSYAETMKSRIESLKWGKASRHTEDFYPDITSVQINQGHNQEGIKIYCRSSADLGKVAEDLFKAGIFQIQSTSNMVWVDGNSIIEAGVYTMIEYWYNSRTRIFKKKFNTLRESARKEADRLEYFIRLVNTTEWRDRYLDLVVNQGRSEALGYLRELFEDIDPDQQDWIYDRKVSAFNRANVYQTRYNTLLEDIRGYDQVLADIPGAILADLEALKQEHQGFHERRTVLSDVDIQVSVSKSLTDNTPPDAGNSSQVYYTLSGPMLYKSSYPPASGATFQAKANDQIIAFDLAGRLLRVFGEDVPTGESINVHQYCRTEGLEGNVIIFMRPVDGTVYTLIYDDGYVSYLDTGSLRTTKKYKLIKKGVPDQVASKLLHVLPYQPDRILLAMDDESGQTFVGIGDLTSLKTPKNSSSRVRAIEGFFNNPARYVGYTEAGSINFVPGDVVENLPVFDEWLMEDMPATPIVDSRVPYYSGAFHTPLIER